MLRVLLWWASNLVALWVAAELVAGVAYDGFLGLVLAALVFGVVNLVLRPLLILLALPAVIVTLGVALLFVNALMVWLTGKLVPGFDVADFFWASIFAAVVVWLVNMALHAVLGEARERRLLHA